MKRIVSCRREDAGAGWLMIGVAGGRRRLRREDKCE